MLRAGRTARLSRRTGPDQHCTSLAPNPALARTLPAARVDAVRLWSGSVVPPRGDGMRMRTLVLGSIMGIILSTTMVLPAQAAPAFRALLFTKTTGYRHDSIPAGISMFQQQASENNFELVQTEDATVFNSANLATFDVVIMFQTSGMVWTTAAQRQAFEAYLASGKGIVAIHNATDMGIDSEYPWWDQTVNAGAHMPQHSPGVLQGTAIVADKKHPSTAALPDRWVRSEEVVQLRPQPPRRRPRVGDGGRTHLQPG